MLDDDSAPSSLGHLNAIADAGRLTAAISAEIWLAGEQDSSVASAQRTQRESGGLPEVFTGCGVAIRREAFLEARGYDHSFGYYVEEYDLAAKLLLECTMPVHCIYGNNDGERAGLKKLLPQLVDGPWRGEFDGVAIAMHHWIEWFKPGETDGARVVISGHTHEIVNEERNGVLYLNPGECCGWLTGRCTVAVLDTESVRAEIVELKD